MLENNMEQKAMFVVNGGIKLPIGYRFHPTDEELVVHYLRRKELGLPLPASVIPELDVFQAEPWSLPGGLKEKRYFFSRLGKGSNIDASKNRRAAGSGYWKVTSKTRPVQASTGNQIVGMRRSLVFCQGKHSTGARAQWTMHEFRLLGPNQQMELGDRWVIYRVFQRKRKPKRHQQLLSKDIPCFMDFGNSNDAGPPQPSSPGSSGIAEEVFCSGLDQEEVSSYH